MMSYELRLGFGNLGVSMLDSSCNALVGVTSRCLEKRLIRRLLNEGMFELVSTFNLSGHSVHEPRCHKLVKCANKVRLGSR